MDAADDGGEIAIHSCDEGKTRGSAEPGRGGAQDGDAFQKGERGDDADQAGARAHDVDGLEDAGEHTDLLMGHGDEHGERGAEVDQPGNDAADQDGDREIAFGIADFIAHDRSEVEADQAVADGAEGGKETPVMEVRMEICYVERVAVMVEGQDGEETDHGCSADGAQGAEIADPFAERETAHVEGQEENDDEQGGDSGEGCAVGKLLDRGPKDVDADS